MDLESEFTFAGISRARSGMWRSPMTRTRREVMVAAGWLLRCLGKVIAQALARRGSGASNYFVYSFAFLN
jgi:hypothetical protein